MKTSLPMLDLLISLIILPSVLLFLVPYLTGLNSQIQSGLILAISLISIFFIYRRSLFSLRLKLCTNRSLLIISLSQLGFILVYLAALALIISPLLLGQKIGQFQFLRLVGIDDFYKHLYVTTALKESGIPPTHPYFPSVSLSYYYGYYLIPAAIAKIFPLFQSQILYFFIILTSLVAFLSLQKIINSLFNSKLIRLVTLPLMIIGTSLDILAIKLNPQTGYKYIENWFNQREEGLIVFNLFSSVIWSPQHFLAAALTLYLVFQLLKERPKFLFTALSLAFITLSSLFVAVIACLWLAIIFVFKSGLRKKIFFSALLSFLILLPYLVPMLNKGGLTYFYQLKPFSFINLSNQFVFNLVNLPLHLIVEHGLIFFLLPILFALSPFRSKSGAIIIFFSIYLPSIATWFLRSRGPNDFAMKLLQPIQLSLPVLLMLIVQRLRPLLKYSSLMIIAPFFLISSLGNLYEYKSRWQQRQVLSLEESDLLKQVRLLSADLRLAVIEREEWVFHLPVLGYKMVLSPSLYDASVYVGKRRANTSSYSFEGEGVIIFFNLLQASSVTGLVDKQNQNFARLTEYFQAYPFDGLLVKNRTWVKQGVNFWDRLFTDLKVDKRSINELYDLFDSDTLLSELKKNQIYLDDNDKLESKVVENQVFLPQGKLFLAVCSQPGRREIKLEFEDYFSVFDLTVPEDNQCLGRVFYHPQAGLVKVNPATTVTKVISFPVNIRNYAEEI
ncbi:hypothetical protein HY333_01065 [Candidatus Collierbacteria bacterium]|nr:hypothetical protein [Candidatus Collierbacteria bacterium]